MMTKKRKAQQEPIPLHVHDGKKVEEGEHSERAERCKRGEKQNFPHQQRVPKWNLLPYFLRSWLSVSFLMQIGGWAHDVFTISITTVDIASDVLVANQFYENGFPVWGHMVWGTVLMSSLMLAFCGAQSLTVSAKDYYQRRQGEARARKNFACDQLMRATLWTCDQHSVARFFILLPFAQLLPLANWAMETVAPSVVERKERAKSTTSSTGGDVDADDGMGARQPSDLLNAEDESKRAQETEIINNFQKGFEQHMQTHILFYVETCVESIPQCIIQLMAISFTGGNATKLQLLSLALSLTSIVSKGYMFSVSFDFKIFLFRFALAAHDVMSLFYFFSSLISSDEPQEVSLSNTFLFRLFGASAADNELKTSWLTYAVFAKINFLAVVLALTVVTVGFLAIFDATHGGRRSIKAVVRDEGSTIVAIAFVVTVCFVPIVLVVETFKLSIVSWLLMCSSSVHTDESFDWLNKCFAFIMSGPTSTKRLKSAVRFDSTASRDGISTNANDNKDEATEGTCSVFQEQERLAEEKQSFTHTNDKCGRYNYILYHLCGTLEEYFRKLSDLQSSRHYLAERDIYTSQRLRKMRFTFRPYRSVDAEPKHYCAPDDQGYKWLKSYRETQRHLQNYIDPYIGLPKGATPLYESKNERQYYDRCKSLPQAKGPLFQWYTDFLKDYFVYPRVVFEEEREFDEKAASAANASERSILVKKILRGIVALFVALEIPMITLSTLYPILHTLYLLLLSTGSASSTHNVVQLLCLAVILPAWVAIPFCWERFFMYCCLCLDLNRMPHHTPCFKSLTVKPARRWIRDFYLPSREEVLLHVISPKLIPEDVVCLTARFLDYPGAVDLKLVSSKLASEMREKWNEGEH